MTTLAVQTETLLHQAQRQCVELLDAEQTVRDDLHKLCIQLWELGKSLAELKELVGHGKWMFFVAANFKILGKEEKTRTNRAGEAIAFFLANPKYPDIGVFAVDSIRKCVFHLAPEKERPQLPGNEPISPAPHQLTFVNHFSKWDQRIKAGLDPAPPVDVIQRDLEPVARRMIELCGREWFEKILR